MFALCDAFTVIDVPLGDPTVIVGPGDTTKFKRLENPFVVVTAMDTFTADVTLTFNTMLEDSTSELLPKKCVIEKRKNFCHQKNK